MKRKLVFAVGIFILLVGCDRDNIKGTYVCDGMMKLELEFEGNGKGYALAMGNKSTMEYKVDGDNLIITSNGNTSVLSINGDTFGLNKATMGNINLIGTCSKK